MKLGLNLLAIALAAASFTLSAQADTVYDLPPSKNYLVNYSIDLMKQNPESTTIDVFAELLGNNIRNSPQKAQLFSSMNQALLQISQETIAGEQLNLSTGDYKDYRPSQSSGPSTRMATAVQDARLYNMVELSFMSSGVLGATMAQLHSLSNAQFKVFADEYIETLKKTQNDLVEINRLKKASMLSKEIEQARLHFGNSIPEFRILEITRQIERNVNDRYAEYYQVNTTPGAKFLESLLIQDVNQVNTKGPKAATVLKLQRQRVLELLSRALSETDVFTDGTKQDIARAAKYYIGNTGDSLYNEDRKKEFKAANTSKEVQALIVKIADLSEGRGLSCRRILAGY